MLVNGFPYICPIHTELTMDDLQLIQEAVFNARTEWYNIGLALGVDMDTLDCIKIDGQNVKPKDKLRETLRAWLQTNTEPTWQAIVNALKSPLIGHRKLATDIEDKHSNTLQPPTTESVLLALRQLMEEKQRLIDNADNQLQQLTQILEQHKHINEALQADNHRLRQELLQFQAEMEEKQHVRKSSRRQLQKSQQTTITQQPPMKQNTIQDMRWEKPSKAPEKMFRGSAVSDSSTAYFSDRHSKKIHSYNLETQKWDQPRIPNTPHTKYTLVIVKKKLTIVGGSSHGKATNSILSLTEDGRKRKLIWSQPEFPEMPSKRYNVTAVCRGHTLIVAGGYNGSHILTIVEVLNTDTRQWSTASPLPFPFSSATAAICGESLYMLGGYDKPEQPTRLVLTCSISKLIESCQPQSLKKGTIWQRIADSPYYFSSCATLYGELVLVGGFDEISNEETADIRTYNRRTDSWHAIRVREMPTAQYRALVVVLHDKMMVVGGLDAPGLQLDRFWGYKKDAVNIWY